MSKALERAKHELAEARDKLERLETSKDIRASARLWSEFLTHAHRCFTKLMIATRNGNTKGWADKLDHRRRKDELLQYAHQARHADEHGIEPITKLDPGGIVIGPKEGNSLYVDSLTVSNGQIEMGPQLARNAKITAVPPSLRLSDVWTRGVRYSVPTSHLGEALKDRATPITVANATYEFLSNAIAEAASLPN